MKHLKTFESYSNNDAEMVNEEFIGGLLKTILSIPIGIIVFAISQFVSGKTISDILKKNLLDVYYNIDRLISILERLSNNTNITDVDKKKINKRIKELKKVKRKYPTLDDYKKKAIRTGSLYNFKNRNYLKNQVMDYQPRVLDDYQIVELLKKIYSDITRSDVRGDDQQGGLQDRLNNMLNNLDDDDDDLQEDDRGGINAFD